MSRRDTVSSLSAELPSGEHLKLGRKIASAEFPDLVVGFLRLAEIAGAELGLGQIVIADNIFPVDRDRSTECRGRVREIVLLAICDPELVHREHPLRLFLDHTFEGIDGTVIVTEVSQCHSKIKQRSLDILGAGERGLLERGFRLLELY